MAAGETATAAAAPEGGSRIRVAVRCRPFNAREKAEESTQAVLECYDSSVIISGDVKREGKTFGYDHVFSSDEGQAAVFEAVGQQLLENALGAYNGCIFAYGQTGAGKSYSVVGDLTSEAEKGILPRACVKLFEMLDERRRSDTSFQATVLASYLEIYNEKLFDLLSGGGREAGGELQVRLHPNLGAIVVNLTECPMESFNEALELFDFGAKRRAVGATQMNATSSRSHAVFTIQVRTVVTTPGRSTESQAKIHFVDLAGSEKQKKSGATGARLKEGIGINQSLTTLGRVISDLTKPGNKGLPPFRDSKLTLLLKDALMGNSRTELLACISPSKFNLEETISTLEFASRCKLVKTSARKNEQSRGDIIVKLTAEKDLIEAQLLQEREMSEERCRQLQEELGKAEEEKKKAEEQAMNEKREVEERLKLLEGQLDKNSLEKEEKERMLREMEDIQKQRDIEKAEAERQQQMLQEQLEELDRTRALLREKEELLQAATAQEEQEEEEEEDAEGADDGEDAEGVPSGVIGSRRRKGTFEQFAVDVQVHEAMVVDRKKGQQDAERKEEELRARLEDERAAQRAREEELLSQMEALKGVQESWALDREQLEKRREAQHHQREAELSKLGMHFTGVESEDMPHAPRLVNLHPDPALKGCLVYYLPIGETTIGASPEKCQVRLAGLNVGAEVCAVANEDNSRVTARSLAGGLVRLNGGLVGEDGLVLQDGDRLAIGRAYIFRVHIPKLARDERAANDAESEFELAMSEIAACAEVDPQWENGIHKAMLLVKSDFGTEAANELLAQARRASEAIAMANTVLQEMPSGWTDGVVTFDLSVMFDAHGLPAVCVVARRAETAGSGGGRLQSCGLRSSGPSAGIWEVDTFLGERLPIMHEALLLAKAEERPGARNWESRVWSEIGIEDYKAVLAELPASKARRRTSQGRVTSPEGSSSGASGGGGWGWLSGAAAQLKHGARAVRHAVKDTAALKDVAKESLIGDDSKGVAHGHLGGLGGGLKSGTPTARKIARAVSPAALLRSLSAGRLERPSARGSGSFAPPARSNSGREVSGSEGSESVRSSLRSRGGRWREEMEQTLGPPLVSSPGARGSPSCSPAGPDRTESTPTKRASGAPSGDPPSGMAGV